MIGFNTFARARPILRDNFLLTSLRRRPLSNFPVTPNVRRTTTRATLKNSPHIPPNGIVVAQVPNYYGFGPVVRLFQGYGRAQRKRPYTTQLLTSITFYLLGDLNAQLLFGDEETEYDALRTLRMVFIGGVLSLPSFKWFLYLSNLFSGFSKPIAIGLRVIVNQIAFTPFFLAAFFSLQSFLTGSAWPEVQEKLKSTLPGAYLKGLQLWPAVTAINFWWIKFEYRSIFSGLIAIGWNSYLSYLNQKQDAKMSVEVTQTQTLPTIQQKEVMPVAVVVPEKVQPYEDIWLKIPSVTQVIEFLTGQDQNIAATA